MWLFLATTRRPPAPLRQFVFPISKPNASGLPGAGEVAVWTAHAARLIVSATFETRGGEFLRVTKTTSRPIESR